MPRGRKKFTNLKDKKVRLIGYKSGRTETGAPTQVYYDLCGPVWANYRSLSGSEIYFAKQAGSQQEVIFTVNWRRDIVAGMYVLYRDKAYKIGYVDDLEGYKKDLKLYCETSSAVNASVLKGILEALEE